MLKQLFADNTDEELLRYGIPAEWLNDVKKATEDMLLALADHLPAEAAEALLELATGGKPRVPQPALATANPFDHPDAQRRFRVMTNVEELQRALDFPWEKWTVFLHPEQRQWVERDYAGPARVSGSAGTGKTIVAENRLAHGTMIRRLRLDSDAAPFSVGRPDSNLETTVSTMPESPRGYCAAGHHLLGGKLGKASGDVVEHGCGNLLPQIGLIGFPSSATQQRLAGHFVPNVIRFAAHPLRQLLFRDFKQAKAQGRRKHQR